jgi:hypothetical protein
MYIYFAAFMKVFGALVCQVDKRFDGGEPAARYGLDRVSLIWGAVLMTLCSLVAPSRALSWEETTKRAFEEKIGIVAAMVNEQREEIDTSTPEAAKAGLRTQCLLQSIGIDVVKRYLDCNPGDQWWQQKHSRLRDGLTVCLGLLYNM